MRGSLAPCHARATPDQTCNTRSTPFPHLWPDQRKRIGGQLDRRILACLRDTKALKLTHSKDVEASPLKTCFAATTKDAREKVGMWEKVRKTLPILGFSDSAWGDNENSRSATGTLMLVALGAVGWVSKCQPTAALSSTEAARLFKTRSS